MNLYQRRRLRNRIFMGLSLAAAAAGLAWLAMILGAVIWNGVPGLNLAVFTEATPPPPGDGGGLANAIMGSLLMIALAMAIGAPVGILAGIYLAEYGRYSRLAMVTRFINDILLSAPSIVIGLFIYETVVVTMGHFSGYAGALALALIVIPIVIRTTEVMLGLVPDGLREAAAGLGASRWIVIRAVLFKAARAG